MARTASRPRPAGAPGRPAPRIEVRVRRAAEPELIDCDVVVAGLTPATGEGAATPARAGLLLADRAGVDLPRQLDHAAATGRAGEIVAVDLVDRPRTLLAVGLGDAGTADARLAGAALGRRIRDTASVVVFWGRRLGPDSVRAWTEGLLLGAYQAPATRSGAAAPVAPVVEVVVAERDHEGVAAAVARGVAVGTAVRTARDLANTPSDVKTPGWLADRAVALAADPARRLTAEVFDVDRLEELGFGGVLAVGSGSASPPRVVRLDYTPRTAAGRAPRVLLVGKGITYDTGGLSLKPREAMVPMKTDMSGAAAVLSAMAALAELGVGVPVTGFLACAENMPSGSAYRPGDVVVHYGGRTSEIFNTDAEGRIVLADALAYGVEQTRPDVVVDVATLTGAASLALGRRTAALFASDDALAAALARAGAEAGESWWRLPLVEDYRGALDSEVADAAHVGRDRMISGGAITAALFLEPFTGGLPWAHLDIAGPARSDADRDDISKGGTGFATRTLVRWLEQGAPGASPARRR